MKVKIEINGKQAKVFNHEGNKIISLDGGRDRCYVRSGVEDIDSITTLIEKIKHIQSVLTSQEKLEEGDTEEKGGTEISTEGTPDRYGFIIDKLYSGFDMEHLLYKGQGMFTLLDGEEYLLLSRDLPMLKLL